MSQRRGEGRQETTWYVCKNQDDPENLIDDDGNRLMCWLRAPLLAYDFYHRVQGTKLWSGKRPLIVIRDRGLGSRIAAYAGSWGGGDVVMPDNDELPPLGPTRFLLDADGSLKMRAE